MDLTLVVAGTRRGVEEVLVRVPPGGRREGLQLLQESLEAIRALNRALERKPTPEEAR